ncbi:SufD family Fe-S cluster assembly protein [Paracoccus sp. Z118]|uniref:SufB/SufD family protein n=1 Tax=Paracoccus sp. Z118 TaxID=2851017 RepID=UPI001C2C5756|nr:SufD family Fe-S cluster assembly protein [Paracoccus sp. Z118]MBV0891791.1 SufD family Fe-S cluster assembly protein [Paracoccus sp. Z118]
MADTAIRAAERTAQVTRDEVTPDVIGGQQPAPAGRLATLEAPQGGCTAGARRDAMQRLVQMGLPKPRDEYWRYTDPKLFNADAPAPIEIDDRDPQMFSTMNRVKLVFVDGAFDADASDPLELAGVTIETLEQADAQPGHWVAGVYGTLEAAGQKPVARPFAALNSATARQGLVIRVTGEAPKPVHIIHLRRDPAADAVLHHVLKLDEGADLTLLETGMSGARTNDVIEVDLAPRARLHHVASVRGNPDRVGLRHMFGRVDEEASLKSFILSLNGSQMRHETVIDIVGDDAVAHVAGAVLGDGAAGPFHHDDTIFITHGAERGESRQVYKKVLKNGAVGVFQGKILVKPGAQKTDGYQISQALLLDEDSQFLAKPELEIYADDVKCSHGSTTGALDPVALYYLRSRGVPKERAVVMLVLSFVADALAEVEDDELRAEISDRLELWLNRHAVSAPKTGGAA